MTERSGIKRPRWDSRWNRPWVIVAFLWSLLALVPMVVWYGLSGVIDEYPSILRFFWKTLRTGKRGPYEGTVW